MSNKKTKTDQFKYTVERTENDTLIHLRMLSPDNGKTHVEYFCFVKDKNKPFNEMIESSILHEMQNKLDYVLKNLDQNKTITNNENNLELDEEHISRLREKIKRIENKKI